MNKSFILYSTIILFLIGWLSFAINQKLNQSHRLKSMVEISNFLPVKFGNINSRSSTQRKAITFIVGKDSETGNPNFESALQFYRDHPVEGTEWVTDECQSLASIQNYLGEHTGEKPWGKINIVVQSNECLSMGIPVTIDKVHTTFAIISDAIRDSILRPLPDSVIDHKTIINLNGCALGKDEKIMQKLAEAFGGKDDEVPVIRSSKHLISYHRYNGKADKYHTAYYNTFYKTGSRPDDKKISDVLTRQYPNDEIDFQSALTRKTPRHPGDTYHYTFNIPVNWVVTFPDEVSRPLLSSKEEAFAFLREQKELLALVKAHKIAADQFRWQFKPITYTHDNGTSQPAILIKGKSTVLCVLRSFTKPGSTDPLIPLLDDERYYTTIQKTKAMAEAHIKPAKE